jgi:hypothetical protein
MAPRIRSPVKLGRPDNATSHLVDQCKHLFIVGPYTLFDPVGFQRAGRAATALIQCRDETGLCLYFLKLLLVYA